jgi:hypothetical protein
MQTPEKKTRYPSVRGKNVFQPIDINWSYRNRGKLALIKIKKKQNVVVFIENQISGKIKSNKAIGDNQPPKNILH